MVGRPPTDKKKKDKNIKVTDEVHRELGQIGRLTEDYGDVVERLIKFYNEQPQRRRLTIKMVN
jgi:predicted CopG family antitoxin